MCPPWVFCTTATQPLLRRAAEQNDVVVASIFVNLLEVWPLARITRAPRTSGKRMLLWPVLLVLTLFLPPRLKRCTFDGDPLIRISER